MASINPPTIPVALQRLFADAGFLSCAQDNQKPCIGNRYYVGNSALGFLLRRWERENVDRTKTFIRSTCEEILQNLIQYKSTDFYDIILTKMLKLRVGLTKISHSYRADVTAQDHINDSIMILDMKIPEHIKIIYGISTVTRPIATLPIPIDTPSLGISRGPIPEARNGISLSPVMPSPPAPPVFREEEKEEEKEEE